MKDTDNADLQSANPVLSEDDIAALVGFIRTLDRWDRERAPDSEPVTQSDETPGERSR